MLALTPNLMPKLSGNEAPLFLGVALPIAALVLGVNDGLEE